MNWHNRLTLARDAAGLTKTKLALVVGVSNPTVTDWESGEIAGLSAENLMGLCDALKVTPHWLLYGRGLGPCDTLIGHDLGERLKAARLKRGISQEKLAAAVGVSKGAVSQWESNATSPRKEHLAVLADTLGVTVNWLVGQDDSDLETIVRQQTHLTGMGLVSRISAALADHRLTQGHVDLIGEVLTQLMITPSPNSQLEQDETAR